MSLLCVACALVCAAFLDCVCATDKFGPWEQDAFYFGLCHTEHMGYRTRKIFVVPEILIPPNHKDYALLIPDLCKPQGMDFVGVVVTVCDTDAQPSVTLKSVYRGTVRRLSKPATAATCYIKEFCN